MSKVVILLALCLTVAVEASNCYQQKYATKWPHCSNLKCYGRTALSTMQSECNRYGSRCSGFSFSPSRGGCLKTGCSGSSEGRAGYGTTTHGYYERYTCGKSPIAGQYHVYYRGGKRATDMHITCSDTASQKGAFNSKIHYHNVQSKCRGLPQATMYILNTHGHGKWECLYRSGTTIMGNHYAFGGMWGKVVYRKVRSTSCQPKPRYSQERCPSGFKQVGAPGTDIGGCGLESCSSRYNKHNQAQCAAHCQRNSRCKAYTWGPYNADRNHQGRRVCTIYPTTRPNQMWINSRQSRQQNFCVRAAFCGRLCQHYRHHAAKTHKLATFYKNEQNKYNRASAQAAAASRSHSSAASRSHRSYSSHMTTAKSHLSAYNRHRNTAAVHHRNARTYSARAAASRRSAKANNAAASVHLKHMANYYRAANAHAKEALKHLNHYRHHSKQHVAHKKLGDRHKATANHHKKQATLAYRRYQAAVRSAKAQAASAQKYYSKICVTFKGFLRKYGHYFRDFYNWDRAALSHERQEARYKAAANTARRSQVSHNSHHNRHTRASASAYAKAASHSKQAASHLSKYRHHTKLANLHRSRGNGHKTHANNYQARARSHTRTAATWDRHARNSRNAGDASSRTASAHLKQFGAHNKAAANHLRSYNYHKGRATSYANSARSHAATAAARGRTSASHKRNAQTYDRLAKHYYNQGKF